LFRRVGIHSIHVVIGHQADEMRMALRHCNVELIVNPNYDEGMFSSVIAGIRNLPAFTEAFFILPVDIPLIRSLTPMLLIDAFHTERALIVHPCFQGGTRCIPTLSGRCETGHAFRPVVERRRGIIESETAGCRRSVV
jgi:probable phosphoglycerate mutase